MPLAQVNAGDKINASDINQFYSILKGVAASGESVTLIYNAAGSFVLQPSSDPATGTELIQIKNNAGTVQMALSSDGKVYAGDGAVGSSGLTFELDKDTGFYRIGANTIGLATNGVERLRVDTTGVSLDGGTTYLGAAAWTTSAALSLTQSGAVTFTTTYARYNISGKSATVQIYLAITGAGTVANAITLGSVPAAIAPKQTGTDRVCGTFVYLQTGITRHSGAVIAASASTLQFQVSGNAGLLGATTGPSFAAANGDVLSMTLSYEIA